MQIMNLKTSLSKKKVKKVTPKGFTKEEKLIWDYIKERKLYNLKFKKHIDMGKYHFNFYSAELEFGIEISDKSYTKNYKTIRDEYLNSNGITAISITASEILGNTEEVLERIKEKIETIKI